MVLCAYNNFKLAQNTNDFAFCDPLQVCTRQNDISF